MAHTSKMPDSDGGLWIGQLLMMWSAVCPVHTHMPHCPPIPTSSWMLCTDRPQFAACLESSSVFSSDLLQWCLLLGPIRGGILGRVRMLPSPASTLPQSMHPSTGPQGCHLVSPEPPCCRVYGTWVCIAKRHFIRCGVVQDVPVVFHCFPCQCEGGCFPP